MKINIKENRKVSDIQKEFNDMFPYLKIDFFSTQSKMGDGTAKKIIKNSNDTLGECRAAQKSCCLSISPQMTVSDLEQLFIETYGLGVLVYRKSGKVWLETTVTDGWTLEDQNKEGEALSKVK